MTEGSNDVLLVPMMNISRLVPACGFEYDLPHSNCSELGIYLEIFMRLLKLLYYGRPPKFRLMKAKGFAYRHRNDSSIFDLLDRGIGDITMPLMTLTTERVRIAEHVGPIFHKALWLVYVDPSAELNLPKVSTWSVIPIPLSILFGILAIFYFTPILRNHFLKKMFPRESMGEMLEERWNVAVFFVFSILLSFLGTHVVLVFNVAPSATDPFEDPKDLIKRLETKTHSALVNTEIFSDILLNPIGPEQNMSEMSLRFLRAAESNPPRLIGEIQEAIDLILSSGQPKYVLVTDTPARYTSVDCRLMAKKYSRTGSWTSFARKGFLKTLRNFDGSLRKVIEREELQLEKKNFKSPSCAAYKAPETLHLSQIEGVFGLCGILMALSFSIFLMELVTNFFISKIKSADRGLADITLPIMVLTSERNKNYENIGEIGAKSVKLVYYDPSVEASSPTVNLNSTIPGPLMVLFAILGIFYVGSIIGSELLKLFGVATVYSTKMKDRWNVLVFFFLTVFLSFITTHLVIVFNVAPAFQDPFQRRVDLINRLGSNEYQAISPFPIFLDLILDPKGGEGELTDSAVRFRRAAQRNPPILDKTILSGSNLDKERNGKKIVILTDDPDQILRFDCRLKAREYSRLGGWTMFGRKGFLRNLRKFNFHLKRIFQTEERRIMNNYRRNAKCESFRSPNTLHLPQIQGVFALSLILVAVSVILFVIEVILGLKTFSVVSLRKLLKALLPLSNRKLH